MGCFWKNSRPLVTQIVISVWPWSEMLFQWRCTPFGPWTQATPSNTSHRDKFCSRHHTGWAKIVPRSSNDVDSVEFRCDSQVQVTKSLATSLFCRSILNLNPICPSSKIVPLRVGFGFKIQGHAMSIPMALTVLEQHYDHGRFGTLEIIQNPHVCVCVCVCGFELSWVELISLKFWH